MVTIENLNKQYGDFRLNISLEIPDGQITGLIGRNGSGKSTTIKSILGLIKPDGGNISVLNKDTKALQPADKEKIGVALMESGFSVYLNVEDVIHVLQKMYKEFDEKWFRDVCSLQGLPLKKQIKEFSTGMRAKLRVIVALSHNAKLLVLDEPTAGLDVEARMEILDMLRDYLAADEERSMLITSHISSDLEGICDDLYLIHEGQVLLHEDTDVILDEYAVLKVDEEAYRELDKEFVLKTRKETFGYMCLTNQKQYYAENYPEIVIESGNIDELILMMTGKE